jgi:predicted acetyltransferase
MAEEFHAEGDPRFDALLADVDGFFVKVERDSTGAGLPAHLVPQRHFAAFAEGRLVGAGRVRHRLSPILLQDGGHIGYEVRRTARGQGHGTALLRVIEKNGGMRDGTSISPHTGEAMARYWIQLA